MLDDDMGGKGIAIQNLVLLCQLGHRVMVPLPGMLNPIHVADAYDIPIITVLRNRLSPGKKQFDENRLENDPEGKGGEEDQDGCLLENIGFN
jgi:hypothetical protein